VTAQVSTGGETVSDSLCRLTVQSGEDDGSLAVDLALPRNADVGLLMPAIVDLVHRDPTTPEAVRRWRLSRLGGPSLDESMTLNDNHVRDGELLLLTAIEPPAPQWVGRDPCHAAAHVDTGNNPQALGIIAIVACLCAAGIGAAALAWSGINALSAGHMITGSLLAAAAAVGAVVARRAQHGALPCVALSVIAAVYTAAVGFLAVPAGPSAANGLLAAAAGLSMVILLRRLTGCGTVCLTAIASGSALASATAAVCVAWTLPAEAAGAALAILSLGLLGVAARVSIMVAGLEPAQSTVDDAQVALAHQTLTGLVIGSSSSVALGSALVALGGLDNTGSWPSAAVFTTVVGLVLLLRARTHSDMSRRIALAAGGMVSAAAAFTVIVVSAPAQAHWMTMLAAAAGTGALGWFCGLTVSPVVRRAIELLEYLALAAVLPLACWAVGLLELVRGLSLT
jgi:type VII secretion integral membrane protein EccD